MLNGAYRAYNYGVRVEEVITESAGVKSGKLKSYLHDVFRSLNPEFKGKNIEVIIDCNENIEINSFPGIFAQIITNLVLNSITHGFEEKEQGQIKITVKILNENLLLEYKDNGKGISQDILPEIFDPFFTTDKQKGTGLGLHIIYNLITQKLNGLINCESEHGKYVIFFIKIPID